MSADDQDRIAVVAAMFDAAMEAAEARTTEAMTRWDDVRLDHQKAIVNGLSALVPSLLAVGRLDPPQALDVRRDAERVELFARIFDLHQDHRRARNVRACTGCSWTPVSPGYASDPEDTRRRNEQFSQHLTQLTLEVIRP